ncbi:MAG: hypothetical protein OEL55_01155 [Desulfobulbaceae bacterium]|nr:hypothetical protein [Desulfobulbaceae bacterium]
MNTFKTIAIAAGLACLAATAQPALAEDAPTADFTVGAYSSYVWRGFELNDNSMVIQPSMTVAYKGFSANVWGNMDTDAASTKNWNETDLTLAYDTSIDKIGIGAGYIYYALDGADDSQEFYVSISYDTLLSPTLTVYRDSDSYNGWYSNLAISHSLAMTDSVNLDLGASVSYLCADDASVIADSTGGAYSEFHDGVLSASATFPVAKYVTVTPSLSYSFPLSSEAETLLESSNPSGDKDIIYGGVSASFAF